ncbi:MAG: hypothetical protein IPL35_10130 [Sphingobacteriales bacterium]|nr:hypothetical protein [Sphingobacteriales bacterium]
MKIHSSVLQSMAIALAITSFNSACSREKAPNLSSDNNKEIQEVVIDKKTVPASKEELECSKENNQNRKPRAYYCTGCGMG